MSQVDLVFRGGMVVDGTGAAPRRADVAVSEGLIVAVGEVSARGREEVDATGLMVAPGWVDIHTHYDGQATWEERLMPSSNLGATTVVFGNCGVGFAPVRPQDRDRLVVLMEGIEDIPGTALHLGLDWRWESFEQYLDVLAAMPHDIDIAAYIPHGALRVYVMGDRGARGEPATPEDIRRMAEHVRSGLLAGAVGFSSSRTLVHRSSAGDPTPSVRAERDELLAIAHVMRELDRGAFQFASDFTDLDAEFGLFRDLARVSGRPLSFAMTQTSGDPDKWRKQLALIDQARSEGVQISAQIAVRPIGLMLGLQGTYHPYNGRPSYEEIAHLPLAERAQAMRQPARRARILAEPGPRGTFFLDAVASGQDNVYELGVPPIYDPAPEESIGARARAAGVTPDELIFDILTANGGTNFLYLPLVNYADGNLDAVFEMLNHPYTINSLSDGGAHVGMICDASTPTYMLSYWARDRKGPRLDVGAAVRRQTRDTAWALGLRDRGVIAPGFRADINLIDFDRLQLGPPVMVHDLPGGARRLNQEASGYVATYVAGQPIFRNGLPTGALPGTLVRGETVSRQLNDA
ncbi:MAG TPA: amidohydrolase family protein [Novosphingobium sp.]|nr:amidohydrolase family protein [Novosphingobium sp.]